MLRRYFHALVVGCFCLAGCAGTTTSVPVQSGATAEQIPIKTMKPDGSGPFPAVVIMHDCSGLGPRSSGSPGRWATELVSQGFVVALPDSFSPRGHPNGVCTDPSPSRNDVGPLQRVWDAYTTLGYLRSLPYVDGAHVGIMGGSHGGSTTLLTMVAPENDGELLAQERRNGFTAAIALYPGCTGRLGTWRTVRQAGGTGTTINYYGVYRP